MPSAKHMVVTTRDFCLGQEEDQTRAGGGRQERLHAGDVRKKLELVC